MCRSATTGLYMWIPKFSKCCRENCAKACYFLSEQSETDTALTNYYAMSLPCVQGAFFYWNPHWTWKTPEDQTAPNRTCTLIVFCFLHHTSALHHKHICIHQSSVWRTVQCIHCARYECLQMLTGFFAGVTVRVQQKRVFSRFLQARHAAQSTNKQRLWVANKERNVSTLGALLCDSWLLLTNGILCNQLCWSSVFTANKTSWGLNPGCRAAVLAWYEP